MTAREHHAQQIFLDGIRSKEFIDCWSKRPFAVQQSADFWREGLLRAPAPQDVERPILRCGHEPSRRIVGHAAKFPNLQRAAESILHNVLGQGEVLYPEDT